jgi:transcriptional regulator with XRE-family HTH domain
MNRLKEARFFAGKPQIVLQLETGINAATISRIECGYLTPTDEQKEKLAAALGVKKGWLFPKGKANSHPSRASFSSDLPTIQISASAKERE